MLMQITGVIRACVRPCVVAVLAASLFAVAWVATPAAARTVDSATDLQTLVNDLGVQLGLRYRASLPEYQRRYDQLGQAIAAWNAAAGTDDDHTRMVTWLRSAITSAMPGSDIPWPAVPKFDEPLPAPTANSEPASPPVGVVTNKPVVPEQPQTNEEPLPEPMGPAAKPTESPAPAPADEKPAAATPDKVPAEQPADTQPARPAVASPAGPTADKPVAMPSSDTDFWLEHPAATDLPPDLMLDDPFKDDPLPADAPAQSNPPVSDVPSLFDAP